jgi:microcystin-dependent protein
MPLTFLKLPLNLKILIFGLSVLTFGITQQNVLITDNTSIAPDASSLLDLNSTSKGVLVPRMTTAQRDQISNPANGLLVFDTDVKCFTYYSSTTSNWSFLCNTGTGGTNTILTTSVSPGANCANGGVLLQFGNDTNGDGILNPSEINTSLDQYVCNGTQGAQGVQGTQGPQGIQGIQGPAGTNGSLPTGIIVMWSGTLATVPSGWALCDGTNGTPDLMDRFVVGAGSTYAPAATGGTNSVTLATANLPSHTHALTAASAVSGGAHTHGLTTASAVSNGGHDHNFNGTTSNNGDHSHTVTVTFERRNSTGSNLPPGGSNASGSNLTLNGTTNNTGAHTHTYSGTTALTGAHTHTLTGNTDSGGAHTHTLSGSTDATGSGSSIENRPPYYALAYIMKL